MKKIIMLLLIISSCKTFDASLNKKASDNDFFGIGLLHIYTLNSLKIYRDKKLSTFDEVSLSEEHFQFNPIDFKNRLKPAAISESIPHLIPAALNFRVLKISKSFYEVVINEKAKEIGYIKIEDDSKNGYSFEDWDTHLPRSLLIYVSETDIFNIDKKTKIDEITSICSFKVLEVKNEWIKIKPCELTKNECRTKEGWIKWHDNNKLLIKVILGVAY